MDKTMQMTKPKKSRSMKIVVANLLDPSFKYTPSTKTNVQNTWRKHGWIPPTELKDHDEKAKA